MIVDYEKLIRYIVNKGKKQLIEAGTNKIEVDVSGGVDSAVTLALAVRTVGADNVIAVHSTINSDPGALERARLVCQKFNVKLIELDMSDEYESLKNKIKFEFNRLGLKFHESDLRDGAFRSTLRAPVGRVVNRYFGDGLRWGTGNADEDEYLRFYQKGGDGEVDNNWLAGIYKGDIYRLARYLGIPDDILNAIPSPDLWGINKQHTDEKELFELTGVELTYSIPHKRKEMGTIEWVSRQRRTQLKKGIDIFLLNEDELSSLNYSKKEIRLIKTIADVDKQTRHKALSPPSTTVDELMSKELVR